MSVHPLVSYYFLCVPNYCALFFDVLLLQAIHCQHRLTKVWNSTPFNASNKHSTRDCISVRSRKAINLAGLHSIYTSNYFTKDTLF
jgi:hypothetical protein